MLHANFMAQIFYRIKVIADRSSALKKLGILDLFCSSDPDLDPMIFISNLTHIPWR